jgi:hypothetical protein
VPHPVSIYRFTAKQTLYLQTQFIISVVGVHIPFHRQLMVWVRCLTPLVSLNDWAMGHLYSRVVS